MPCVFAVLKRFMQDSAYAFEVPTVVVVEVIVISSLDDSDL
jgi:hypothetical protein